MLDRNEYKQYERDGIWLTLRWVILGTLLTALAGSIGFCMSFPKNAAKVVYQEYSPEALLRKYSWFKDASAALDAKRANLSMYEGRLKNYHDLSKLSRTQQEQVMLWETEQAGVAASYNDLAAEYNAQMVKFNWRFTNRGDLPQGAIDPLPREYKPYITGDK